MRVLLAEDSLRLQASISQGLREAGYAVDAVGDGKQALIYGQTTQYDVIVLDLMLPSMDGLAVLRGLRERGVKSCVLILTARDGVEERVRGLRAGADDYLVKPFAFAELLARVEALLRRGASAQATTRLRVGDLEMDLLARTVRRGEREIDLLPREFRLLEFLMRHADQVVTRTMLLENVWDYHFDPQTNVIDVHVSRLRQKIDKGFDEPLLHTVRGVGYILHAPG